LVVGSSVLCEAEAVAGTATKPANIAMVAATSVSFFMILLQTHKTQ
jgi:hypothetical protein